MTDYLMAALLVVSLLAMAAMVMGAFPHLTLWAIPIAAGLTFPVLVILAPMVLLLLTPAVLFGAWAAYERRMNMAAIMYHWTRRPPIFGRERRKRWAQNEALAFAMSQPDYQSPPGEMDHLYEILAPPS